jgi:hypothetical protein
MTETVKKHKVLALGFAETERATSAETGGRSIPPETLRRLLLLGEGARPLRRRY